MINFKYFLALGISIVLLTILSSYIVYITDKNELSSIYPFLAGVWAGYAIVIISDLTDLLK